MMIRLFCAATLFHFSYCAVAESMASTSVKAIYDIAVITKPNAISFTEVNGGNVHNTAQATGKKSVAVAGIIAKIDGGSTVSTNVGKKDIHVVVSGGSVVTQSINTKSGSTCAGVVCVIGR